MINNPLLSSFSSYDDICCSADQAAAPNAPSRTQVFQAIQDKDAEKLGTLLKSLDVLQLGVNADGDSPLFAAAKCGDGKVMTALLKAVPDNERTKCIQQTDISGQTVLNLAVLKACHDVVTALLNAVPENERAKYVQKYFPCSHSALSLATLEGQHDILTVLLNAVPENERVKCAPPFLPLAVQRRHYDAVTVLLNAVPENERAKCVQQIMQHHHTVSHLIAKRDDHAMMAAILNTVPEKDERTALINEVNAAGEKWLIQFARAGAFQVVQWLLDNGADVNVVDKKKRSALMHAAKRGHASILALFCDPNATELMHAESEKLGALLKKPDPDIDAFDSRGWNALMYAGDRGDKDAVRGLQESDADADLAGLMFCAHLEYSWHWALDKLDEYADKYQYAANLTPVAKNGLQILQQGLQAALQEEKATNTHLASRLNEGIARIDKLIGA